VRDRLLGTTERVSVSASGGQANLECFASAISDDGRYVAFVTRSSFAPGDTNGFWDVYVRDRVLGTTELVSVSTTGANGNEDSGPYGAAMSADGRFVAFESIATNFAGGDSNANFDVFVRDRSLGTTTLVSVNNAGLQGNSGSYAPTISADGRFVAFSSAAFNLVSGDTNGTEDLFVRDRLLLRTERVNVSSSGVQADQQSISALISSDGRFVAFYSYATNLVAGDTNGFWDTFVHDRSSGATERVSVSTIGAQGNSPSQIPAMSADARFVAFTSDASNLDPADMTPWRDLFVRDRGPAYSSTTYCFGDGTGSACPCGNDGSAGNGCANSIVTAGGHLYGNGSASITSDTFVLNGSGMPNSSVLYFQGTAQVNGGAGTAFGDGLRCAGGSVIRIGTKINAMNSSTYPATGDIPISVKGAIPASGGTRTYQAWYRNNTGSCGSGFNLTNGAQVTWVP
jgi:hypothetical protein